MRFLAASLLLGGSLLAAASAFVLAAEPAPRAASAQPVSDEAARFFETRVRPLLATRCAACHGEKRQQAGLRLDSRAALLKAAADGRLPVVPGDPEKSALVQAVRYTGAVKMPPGGRLPPGEIEALEQWVRIGAPWPEAPPAASAPSGGASRWWSFQPVRRPALPRVRNAAWCRSPVDRFLLAGLEKRGLRPAPPADRRTLICRATFDLTGLPPTPGEIDVFLRDRSSDAWPKVVDRLLASPHFGDRWARHWLDLVRYCDSFDARILGENNPGRNMDVTEAWRYRDWVVRAFKNWWTFMFY